VFSKTFTHLLGCDSSICARLQPRGLSKCRLTPQWPLHTAREVATLRINRWVYLVVALLQMLLVAGLIYGWPNMSRYASRRWRVFRRPCASVIKRCELISVECVVDAALATHCVPSAALPVANYDDQSAIAAVDLCLFMRFPATSRHFSGLCWPAASSRSHVVYDGCWSCACSSTA